MSSSLSEAGKVIRGALGSTNGCTRVMVGTLAVVPKPERMMPASGYAVTVFFALCSCFLPSFSSKVSYPRSGPCACTFPSPCSRSWLCSSEDGDVSVALKAAATMVMGAESECVRMIILVTL